jgi:hypothetical protein
MAHDKRYMAQKRQRRRRKSAREKVRQYEAGQIKYDQLPQLARTLLRRRRRAQAAAAK